MIDDYLRYFLQIGHNRVTVLYIPRDTTRHLICRQFCRQRQIDSFVEFVDKFIPTNSTKNKYPFLAFIS